MSVRTELEEVFKWIAGLMAKPAAPPSDDTPIPRESWKKIEENLGRVAEWFGRARAELTGDIETDLAADLQREATNLSRRARVLARRAEPEKEPAPPATRIKDRVQRRRKGGAKTAKKQKSAAKRTTPVEPEPKTGAELVAAAARTIETARTKIDDVEDADAVAAAFGYELDLLAEMTLSLQARIAPVATKQGS